MPYGITNEKPEQTRWMERCVSSVMEANPSYKESRAIAICKAQLKKNNWKVKKSGDEEAELSMRDELWELEKKIRDAVGGPSDLRVESGPWVADVFDDYVIVEKGSKLYKVDWKISGDEVSVDWSTAIEVERMTVYEPVSKAEEKPPMKVPPIVKKNSGRIITYGGRTAC